MDKVNALPNFDANAKSIRDRFRLLAKKHKAKMGKEERSTGGGDVDLSDVEILLEKLIEIEDDTNQRAEEDQKAKKNNEDEDRAKALEMRKRAMESMGETRERLRQPSSEEKKRRTANKSMEFLEKAIEKKQQMQEEEKKAILISLRCHLFGNAALYSILCHPNSQSQIYQISNMENSLEID